MVLELRLSRRADLDLDEIYQHGAQTFGLDQADRYAVNLLQALDQICAFPFLGSPVEAKMHGLRRKPSGAHIIVYRVTDTAILVLRILHQRMEPARHL